MSAGPSGFKHGTLWNMIQDRSARAMNLGALRAIQTTSEFVQQNGVQFLVRMVTNLARKDQARKEQDEKAYLGKGSINPFLPYDEDLFVADVSDSHVCLLNKFNVIDHHILIVTRVFEDQETFLTIGDFEAMWRCMGEFDGLAFYNAGTTAGASQRHKHLQVVPLPLAPQGPKIPIESALTFMRDPDAVGSTPHLHFVHAICPVNSQWLKSRQERAKETLACYYSMLDAVGLLNNDAERPLGAYNLLITRQWMLLVPRSKECVDSISINALGFAGALLVKNSQEMRIVRETGPLNMLQRVALAE